MPQATRPQYSSSSSSTCLSGVDEAPLGQVGHECADAEGPGLAFGARLHAVDQRPELGSRNGDDVAMLVGKAHAGLATILRGSEHRSQEECETVRVLVVRTYSLCNEILGIA